MALKTLSSLFQHQVPKDQRSLFHKARVLVRTDYNVPFKDGMILDDSRLEATLPTLRALQDLGARLILLSHYGRPKGRVDLRYSLAFLAPLLSQKLGQEVRFAKALEGQALETETLNLGANSLLLLENVRFHQGEEILDDNFASHLARLGDIYVNDAFSVAHRSHTSVVSLPKMMPSYAGFLFEKEYHLIQTAIQNPPQPVMAIVAGSKISTKLSLLERLLEKVQILGVGGGIANTFLAAQGFTMGHSLVEDSMIEIAQRLLSLASQTGCRLLLPKDVAYSQRSEGKATGMGVASVDALPPEACALDIGPETVSTFCAALRQAKTVLWNGPLGRFEQPPFDQGTVKVAQEVARLTRAKGLTSVAGGGETAAVLKHAGVEKDLSGLSLSGGAFLEALEGNILPGVAALTL